MRLSIIVPDKTVIIDGFPVVFDFRPLIESGIHAVQWNGSSGEIEFTDRPNTEISNITEFQPVLDAYYEAITVQEQDWQQAEIDRLAALTYAEKRQLEYPAVGDQLEAIWSSLQIAPGSQAENVLAEIQAIKDKYPKPTE